MFYPILYSFIFLIIWWSYIGYPAYLFKNKRNKIFGDNNYGKFSVLVPVFNEKKFIKQKILNLLNLDYPKQKIEIIFVDGGSSDGSLDEISKYGVKYIIANRGNKISDINFALGQIKAEYVLISDADSLIHKCTLKRFDRILSNPEVGAVGAYTIPGKSTKEEKKFWKKNNSLRLLENDFFSTSSLVASCYAFKKNIIKRIPNDVIADDLYVTYKILSKGYVAIYDKESKATENRAPSTFPEMVKHKMRKGHADIREMRRFLFTAKKTPFWGIIFPTKVLQTVVVPVILPPFLILTFINFILSPIFIVLMIIFSILTIFFGPELKTNDLSIFKKMKLFFVMNFILLLVLISYPISEKTSRYKKTN